MGTVNEKRATSQEVRSERLDRSYVALSDNGDSIFYIPRLLYIHTLRPPFRVSFGSYGFEHQNEDNFRGN
jgi:hypothetical protein